jgi:hypothetical protein
MFLYHNTEFEQVLSPLLNDILGIKCVYEYLLLFSGRKNGSEKLEKLMFLSTKKMKRKIKIPIQSTNQRRTKKARYWPLTLRKKTSLPTPKHIGSVVTLNR